MHLIMLGVCYAFNYHPKWCYRNSLCLFVEFAPPLSEKYFTLTNSFWSTMILCFVCVRPCRYDGIAFLLPLNINQENYQLFELDRKDAEDFIRRKNWKLKLVDVIIWLIIINGVFLANTMEIIRKSLMVNYNPFWVIFWNLLFLYWVLHTTTNLHQTPIIFTIIQDYLNRKQKAIERKIHELNEKLLRRSVNLTYAYNKFIEINHLQILFEITFQQYNNRMRRYLSILFIFLTILITYLFYILFLSGLPIDYVPIYAILCSSHIGLMALLIISCGRIASLDKRFNHNNQTMLQRITNRQRKHINRMRNVTDKFVLWKEEFKYSNVMACMSRRPLGFTLINGYLVTTETLFDQFRNVSTFFFLIFGSSYMSP
ncbi:26S proteasome regulatory subunit [Sarcoptes scabiei]|nr:26S proteasome regulatory subunit [Sarcoptes scabiei]